MQNRAHDNQKITNSCSKLIIWLFGPSLEGKFNNVWNECMEKSIICTTSGPKVCNIKIFYCIQICPIHICSCLQGKFNNAWNDLYNTKIYIIHIIFYLKLYVKILYCTYILSKTINFTWNEINNNIKFLTFIVKFP